MNGSLKNLALTFSVLAVNAAASVCGGKTVYFKAPSDWNAPFYYYAGGGWGTVTAASRNGDWYVFSLTGGPTQNENTGFAIGKENQHGTSTQRWVGGVDYNVSGQSPADNASKRIPCTAFGSGDVLYISESPTMPGRTIVSNYPPNAKYFYFLPPSEENWIIGTPYLAYLDGTVMKKIKLEIDPTRCGWYRKVFFNEPVPNGPAWIWLNENAYDQVGLLGLDEDPVDWIDGVPVSFNLFQQFGDSDGEAHLFFMPADGGAGWRRSDPGIDGVCTYKFAAIIYDTDWSVNSSFQCGIYGENYNNNQNSACYSLSPNPNGGTTPLGYGINKGIPQQTLVLNGDGVMKMQWNPSSVQKDGWTQQNFIDAFKPTPGKNVVRNYDMPFARNSSGLWEFNSSKLCRDGQMDLDGNCSYGGGYMGGFFPPELQIRGTADYSLCPACDTKRRAEGWVPLDPSIISQFCYDRGRRGTSNGPIVASCGATTFGQGDFRDGDNPAIWDWGNNRPNFSNIVDKNQLFCFESSPAEFIYEPGQELFFSGDDDIWVFINNQLVIDLGGTHLAAPGYVNLDDLGLTPGYIYPINIFFCDRRTPMSNIRITTNIYFAQSNSLTVKDQGQISGSGAQVCVESSGCGSQMGNILDYYMLNRRGDRLELNTSNPECIINGNNLVCYGGITLTNWPNVDRVIVRPASFFGLIGTQKIYAEVKPSERERFLNAAPVLIYTFSISTTVKTVWGRILRDDNKNLIYDLGQQNKNVVSGKLVPIGFAAGEWSCNDPARYGETGCEFEVLMSSSQEGGSFGQRVNVSLITEPGGIYSGLKFYTDSLGQHEVSPASTFEIPSTGKFAGLLVLWVAGDYRAHEDQSHIINKDLRINTFLPRLAFINPDALPTVTRLAQTKGSDPSLGATVRDMGVLVGTRLDRAVAAYDVSGGSPVLCTTCEFPLFYDAWAEDDLGNRLDNNPKFGTGRGLINVRSSYINIENGIASFSVQGTKPVIADTFAFFTVRGPSEKPETIAKWDSLLFYGMPIAYPMWAEIFDRNGDGIGDSLRIVYSRKFHADSLPNKLLVTWDPGTTLAFGLGTKDGDEYSNRGINPAENRIYWNSDHPNFKTRIENDSVIVIYGIDFSEGIKTSATPGELVSWVTATFYDKGTMTFSFYTNIEGRGPTLPIRPPQISSANSAFATQNAVHLQTQNSGRLDIYSLNGKLAKTLNFASGTHSVSLSHLPKGMYIIKVSFDRGVNMSHPIVLRALVM